MISSQIDTDKDLTIHTCTGLVTIRDFLTRSKEYYHGKPTLHAIWDLTEADISFISPADIKQIVHDTKATAHSREGGKSAIVSPKDFIFGLGRMYQAFSEIEKYNFSIAVFRTIQEAKLWIFD